jgi:hypothetical protein
MHVHYLLYIYIYIYIYMCTKCVFVDGSMCSWCSLDGWGRQGSLLSLAHLQLYLCFYNIKVCPELFSQNNKEVTILSIGTFMGYPLVCVWFLCFTYLLICTFSKSPLSLRVDLVQAWDNESTKSSKIYLFFLILKDQNDIVLIILLFYFKLIQSEIDLSYN